VERPTRKLRSAEVNEILDHERPTEPKFMSLAKRRARRNCALTAVLLVLFAAVWVLALR
jgi:hypothetical protein